MSRNEIASIEVCRVPLKWRNFRKVYDVYPINPRWLATGVGARRLSLAIPEAFDKKLKRSELFSRVYRRDLSPVMDNQLAERMEQEIRSALASADRDLQQHPPLVEFRARQLVRLTRLLPLAMSMLKHPDFVNASIELVQLLVGMAQDQGRHATKEEVGCTYEAFLAIAERLPLGVTAEADRTRIWLTDTETSDLLAGNVKAQLPSLLEQLRKATAEPGKKTALAKFLRAPLASVSRWLSEKREPGGETVLQMQAWLKRPK